MPTVPSLPGQLIDHGHASYLKECVSRLLGIQSMKFPGSQPVSFKTKDLERLKQEDYWVCEKSDGIRVLVYIKLDQASNEQNVYLIDRKNDYREVYGLYFPHYDDPRNGLKDTIIDGELVIDVEPSGKETLRLWAFDCIAVDGTSVMEKPLINRYGKLQQWVARPFEKMMKEMPNLAVNHPFDVKVKRMERSYSIDLVIKELVPRLQHPHDGLIYTCASSGYVVGTDHRILKWKPPSENSVDFKLELRFPPSRSHADGVDYYAKPRFMLLQWCGGNKYDFYDELQVSDDEWEKMKETGEQYDDRVVEVAWNIPEQNWKILRFRDDKTHGNHRDVVASVVESILDGVEMDLLTKGAPEIRAAWKLRESQGAQLPPSGAKGLPPAPIPPQAMSARYCPFPPNEYGKVSGPRMVAGWSR